jgi:CBS domain containing-hemolysin-like protein
MPDEIRLYYFVVAGLLLAANAFFVAVEFSLASLRRTKIEALARRGSRAAAQVRQLALALDECLSTCQVGITLASLGLGWIGERTFAALFELFFRAVGLPDLLAALRIAPAAGTLAAAHTLAVVLAFLLITFLHVVLGELAPKSVAIQFPETLALWLAYPLRFFNWIFHPLVWLLNNSSWTVLKLFGVSRRPFHALAHSPEELGLILDESRSAGLLGSDERRMLERVFRFHDKTIREIMVPRPDMVALSLRASEEEAVKAFSESGYSRLPVYDGTLDKIVGIAYVKDLLYSFQHPKLIKLADLLREVPEVPETSLLSPVLREFQRRRVHMAIVVDEFGATAGLVTLEDIIEEIVGEIRDEHDQEPELIERLPDGTTLMDGMLQLDRFKETFPETQLPQGDFDTVGGLVLNLAGRLPKEGDTFRLGNLTLRVVKREGRRLRKVAVRASPAGPPAAAPPGDPGRPTPELGPRG